MRIIKIVALLIFLSAVPALAVDSSGLGPKEDFEASWETCCNAEVAASSAQCNFWADSKAAELLGTRAPTEDEREKVLNTRGE